MAIVIYAAALPSLLLTKVCQLARSMAERDSGEFRTWWKSSLPC